MSWWFNGELSSELNVRSPLLTQPSQSWFNDDCERPKWTKYVSCSKSRPNPTRGNHVHYVPISDELDEHGVTQPHVIFSMCLQKTYEEMSPKLYVVFCLLIRYGLLPWCCNCTCAYKTGNNRPKFITPILSSIYEKLTVGPLFDTVKQRAFYPNTNLPILRACVHVMP